jgi:hypothetical protein
MNAPDPLANLQPLREPPPIDAWPPAPGWWLLALLVVCGIVALLYAWHRRRARLAYRRHALQQLALLEARFAAGADPCAHVTQINALLKRVALMAFPERNLAALHGDGWLQFLNQSAPGQPPFSSALATAHYSGDVDAATAQQAQRCAAHWIKHHEVGA